MSVKNGKDLKFSFHKSGQVQLALTSELTQKLNIKNQERYLSKIQLAKPGDEFKDAKINQIIDIDNKYEVCACIAFSTTELCEYLIDEEILRKKRLRKLSL